MTSTAIGEPRAIAPIAGVPDTQRGLVTSLLSGLVWTAAAKWSTQFSVGRRPWWSCDSLSSDYGVVGMATVFLGMATVLSEFGLGSRSCTCAT